MVFPTETVYGLGADAFNPDAVSRVYSAKGRPGDNPLILHVDSAEKFPELALNPPEYAFALLEAFWPGPLSVVVKKKPSLPRWLGGHPSGATDTIGIRMPSHPTALAFIKEAGCVIAAPSANKAGKPSPTTLAHVLEDFAEHNIVSLDGGNAALGLESTVVDITGERPRILRPGFVTSEEIRAVTRLEPDGAENSPDTPRSPGMKYRHYAPQAKMTIISGSAKNVADYISRECSGAARHRIGVLVGAETRKLLRETENMEILNSGENEKAIAANLFARLRYFDKLGVDLIFAEAVPDSGLGAAIMDRKIKAAEGVVIHV